jgi:hypothetical protein
MGAARLEPATSPCEMRARRRPFGLIASARCGNRTEQEPRDAELTPIRVVLRTPNLNVEQSADAGPVSLGQAVQTATATPSHPTLAIASNQTATIAVRRARRHFPFVAEAAMIEQLLH